MSDKRRVFLSPLEIEQAAIEAQRKDESNRLRFLQKVYSEPTSVRLDSPRNHHRDTDELAAVPRTSPELHELRMLLAWTFLGYIPWSSVHSMPPTIERISTHRFRGEDYRLYKIAVDAESKNAAKKGSPYVYLAAMIPVSCNVESIVAEERSARGDAYSHAKEEWLGIESVAVCVGIAGMPLREASVPTAIGFVDLDSGWEAVWPRGTCDSVVTVGTTADPVGCSVQSNSIPFLSVDMKATMIVNVPRLRGTQAQRSNTLLQFYAPNIKPFSVGLTLKSTLLRQAGDAPGSVYPNHSEHKFQYAVYTPNLGQAVFDDPTSPTGKSRRVSTRRTTVPYMRGLFDTSNFYVMEGVAEYDRYGQDTIEALLRHGASAGGHDDDPSSPREDWYDALIDTTCNLESVYNVYRAYGLDAYQNDMHRLPEDQVKRWIREQAGTPRILVNKSILHLAVRTWGVLSSLLTPRLDIKWIMQQTSVSNRNPLGIGFSRSAIAEVSDSTATTETVSMLVKTIKDVRDWDFKRSDRSGRFDYD